MTGVDCLGSEVVHDGVNEYTASPSYEYLLMSE